jgi:minor extracellular serine protease Vpr
MLNRTLLLIAAVGGMLLGQTTLSQTTLSQTNGERSDNATHRLAILLTEQPLIRAASTGSKEAVADQQVRLAAQQNAIRAALQQRKIPELGSLDYLINAIIVQASIEQAAELENLPGVRGVTAVRNYRRQLNRATELVRAPQAWTVLNGENNAGAGMRIAILDSGIDHTHPALQDSTLSMPSGFPKCVVDNGECDFVNTKVIAARSYVSRLEKRGAGSPPYPDDRTPRDRSGHGTAAASVAAGRRVQGPAATVVGVAPKAYLGNYKIFGTPGINDQTTEDVVVAALADAINDGMDVINLSFGQVAEYGPYQRGTNSGRRLDLFAEAVENAVRLSSRAVIIVASAGNAGDATREAPGLQTIDSPATADEVIAVGATFNSHEFFNSLRTGEDAPSSLRRVNGLFGSGPRPGGAFQAPLRDVARLDNNGEACEPLTRGSVAGAIALIRRGGCTAFTKVVNAQRAGAVAAVIYNQSSGDEQIFPFTGLRTTGIPTMLIGNSAGSALAQFLTTRGNNYEVVLDPALSEQSATADRVAFFSSHGPALETYAVKPELVATGTDMYMATQKSDPNGDLYDASGYINAQGTSFAAPMVAGAAALVKQRNPNLTWQQYRSLIINTAVSDGIRDGVYTNGITSILASGAGKLHVENAVNANVTVTPSTLSFWDTGTRRIGTLPARDGQSGIQLTNLSNQPVTLRLSVRPRTGTNDGVTISTNQVTLAPGAAPRTVGVQLAAVPTQPGIFEGFILVEGGAVTMRVPYLFIAGDNRPFDIFSLFTDDFVTLPNVNRLIAFKAIDQNGMAVRGLSTTWRSVAGGGTIIPQEFDDATDILGIAAANIRMGSNLGTQTFQATAGGFTIPFTGRVIARPTLDNGGVVNAASNQLAGGLAPGSYISIYGVSMADTTRFLSTPFLPLTMSNLSVAFEVPGTEIRFPGRLSYVSPGQINVQVPWELAGRSQVAVSVNFGSFFSASRTVPLQNHSPALFEYVEANTDRIFAAALDQNNALITSNNRARRNQVITLYCNGLGPVSNRPATGDPSPSNPVATTIATPRVTIGGQEAPVQFSGLSPQSIGLYQINVVVPGNVGGGSQPVEIQIGGQASKTVNIPVE